MARQHSLSPCASFNYSRNCVWMSHFLRVLIVLANILIAVHARAKDYGAISNREQREWMRPHLVLSHGGFYELSLCALPHIQKNTPLGDDLPSYIHFYMLLDYSIRPNIGIKNNFLRMLFECTCFLISIRGICSIALNAGSLNATDMVLVVLRPCSRIWCLTVKLLDKFKCFSYAPFKPTFIGYFNVPITALFGEL